MRTRTRPADPQQTAAPFWSRPVQEMALSLESALTGLDSAAAKERLEIYGPNRISPKSERGWLPLLPKQILLNNFLSDLPSAAISTDRVDAEQVREPQRWDVGYIRRFMVVFGLISSVFDLITFGVLLYVLKAGETLFQTSWFIVSLLTELIVVLILRTRRMALRSAPGSILLWSTVAVIGLTLVLPLWEPFARVFGFTTLTIGQLGVLVAIVLAYALTTEVGKHVFFRALALADDNRGPLTRCGKPERQNG